MLPVEQKFDYSAVYPREELNNLEEEGKFSEIAGILHHRMKERIIGSMLAGKGAGQSLEAYVSHGTFLQVKHNRTYSSEEIAADYDRQDELGKGDNLGNVLAVCEAIDQRLEHSSDSKSKKQRNEFIRQAIDWVTADDSPADKLRSCPEIRDTIWQNAVMMHVGYAYGHGDLAATWANAGTENQFKSYAVSYAMVDRALRVILADSNQYSPEALSLEEIRQLKDTNMLTETKTKISNTWQKALQEVRFKYGHALDGQRMYGIENYQRLLTSDDPIAQRGLQPMSKKGSLDTIIGTLTSTEILSACQTAGADAHENWVDGQLASGRQPTRYLPGETYGKRATATITNGDGTTTEVTVDPRLIPYVFLTEQDQRNNDAAAAFMAAYIDVFFAQNPSMVIQADDILELGRRMLTANENDPALKAAMRMMHVVWAKIAAWREGRTECVTKRPHQFQLTNDLTRQERSYDIDAIHASLPPLLAAFIYQCRKSGYAVEVPKKIVDVTMPYLVKIVD